MKWLLKLLGLQRVKPWDRFDPKDDPFAGLARCMGCGEVVRQASNFDIEEHECLPQEQIEEILSQQSKGEDEQ